MAYRDFVRPTKIARPRTTQDWIEWLDSERVLHPVAPAPIQACVKCYGAVGVGAAGTAYELCWNCRSYGAVDVVVPITYSLDDGLESLLHRFKDHRGYEWLSAALGSLLWTFLTSHLSCIERAAGTIDIAVPVPPDTTRAFVPTESVIAAVEGPRQLPWRFDLLARDRDHPRPARGGVSPEAYAVRPGAVRRKTVLVLDDTWTSGASSASVAAALKARNAARVVVLTLGRQLNSTSTFGTSPELVRTAKSRAWEDSCVLCD